MRPWEASLDWVKEAVMLEPYRHAALFGLLMKQDKVLHAERHEAFVFTTHVRGTWVFCAVGVPLLGGLPAIVRCDDEEHSEHLFYTALMECDVAYPEEGWTAWPEDVAHIPALVRSMLRGDAEASVSSCEA